MTDIKRLYGGDWNEKHLQFFAIALATFLLTANLMSMKFFEVYGFKFGAGVIFVPLCLVVGEALNTAVFQITAFGGIMSLLFLGKVILNGTIIKTLIEALLLPLTSWLCDRMKKIEGVDYFDEKPVVPQ